METQSRSSSRSRSRSLSQPRTSGSSHRSRSSSIRRRKQSEQPSSQQEREQQQRNRRSTQSRKFPVPTSPTASPIKRANSGTFQEKGGYGYSNATLRVAASWSSPTSPTRSRQSFHTPPPPVPPTLPEGSARDVAEEEKKDELQPIGELSDDSSDSGKLYREVMHRDGATPLFLAIEDTDWRRALPLIRDQPESLITFVVSTGTVDTTFQWSQWRRLPIHEACRRQAPAWFVAALLSASPNTAGAKTQFGELPLHLAVECGAAPEVVNLLMVTYWHGVVCQDKSGRTPIDILKDNAEEHELWALDDHRVMYESLHHSKQTYEQIMKDHADAARAVDEKHNKEVEKLQEQHTEEIKKEHEKQDDLRKEVEMLKHELERERQINSSKQQEIDNFGKIEVMWSDRLEDEKRKVSQLERDKLGEEDRVKSLKQTVQYKDGTIRELEERVEELSTDLQMVTAWQEVELNKSLRKAQRNVRKFVDSFVNLHGLLSEHGHGLRALLEVRGIELPSELDDDDDDTATRFSSSPNEEKKADGTTKEDDVDAEEAMNMAAAAASTALEQN